MDYKKEAINHSLKTLESIRKFLDDVKKDLKSGEIENEVPAIITIKALDDFFKSDLGLHLWCDKIRQRIDEEEPTPNQLH